MLVFRLLQTSFGSRLHLDRPQDDGEVPVTLDPGSALPLVQRALLERSNLEVLRAQAAEWTQPFLVTDWDDQEVGRRFMDGVGRGEIRIIEEKPPEWVPPPRTLEASAVRGLTFEPKKETKKKAWIALELVDQDGEPVPNEKYKVELPDGSVREGNLDSRGKTRIDDIDPPGTCKVSFPDLDAADWKAA